MINTVLSRKGALSCRLASFSVLFASALAASAASAADGFWTNDSIRLYSLRIKGFNGYLYEQRIQTPILGLDLNGQTYAVTGDVTGFWSLRQRSFSPNQVGDVLIKFAPDGQAQLAQINLVRPVYDVAMVGGKLFTSETVNGTLTISEIASDGQLIPRVSTPSVPNGPYFLAGDVDGHMLTAIGGQTTANNSGRLLTYDVSQNQLTANLSLAGFGNSRFVGDTALSSDGNRLSSVWGTSPGSIGTRRDFELSTGNLITTEGTAENGLFVNASDSSDAFDVPVNETITQTKGAFSNLNFADNALFRKPKVLSGRINVSLYNGVAPDGYSVDSIAAVSLLEQSGPVQASVTNAPLPGGEFAARELGHADFVLDLSNTPKGYYSYEASNELSAILQNEQGGQIERLVREKNGESPFGVGSVLDFGYDPVSSNIIGNGDGELRTAGWFTELGSVSSISNFLDEGRALQLTTDVSQRRGSLSQSLELAFDDGPMIFSVDFQRLLLSSTADLQLEFFLGGIKFGQTTVNYNDTIVSYSTAVDLPQFYGSEGLLFNVVVTNSIATTPASDSVLFDNFKLVPIPEPASAGALLLAAAAGLCRRSRRG